MTDLPQIDPDLEQVIQDLERDPEAGLFLTTPRRLLCGLRDGSWTVPASRTGLAAAERKILDVYRHEMAWLLQRAFLRELMAHPDSVQGRVAPSFDRREPVRDWGVRIQPVPAALRKTPASLTLQRYLSPPTEPALPSRRDLIAASLALEDTPLARLYLAIDLCISGQLRSAEDQACLVASQAAVPRVRASAFAWAGVALWSLGKPTQALRSYRAAYRVGEGGELEPDIVLENLFNILGLSLDLGDRDAVLETSRRITELEPDGSLARQAAKRVRARGTDREVALGQAPRDLALQLQDKLPPASWEFIHALL